MIFRAIFWIGLVALLMPHEPDLGFGRPDRASDAMTGGVANGVAGEVAGWTQSKLAPGLADPKTLCRFNTQACSAGASAIDNVRDAAMHGLAGIKADIEADRRARRGG
ncbi:MAG: hypothetical protein JOZ72_14880 [Alphaproteobacteria bacterium]|nr:hypothetical protein [Alphaproteobacteria bacterium]